MKRWLVVQYCEFSFEMKTDRELPYFCSGCGRRLRGKEE